MTPEIADAIRELATSGAAPKDICRTLGLTKGTVSGWLSRNRGCRPILPPVPPPPSERPDFPPPGRCLWINGDPRTTDFDFCAKPTGDTLDPWCPGHRKRVFVREREDRA